MGRMQAKEEDAYSEKIRDARQMENIKELKLTYLKRAENENNEAKSLFAQTQDEVDFMLRQLAEVDAKWSEMSTVPVQEVPLVRKYKASAQPFHPPATYKFSYKFTYKGKGENSEE